MTGPVAPQMMMFPNNRRGRPRVSAETVVVATRLPVSDYNRLYRIAEQRRTTLAGILRDLCKEHETG